MQTLETICLRILEIGNEHVRRGALAEGCELCELSDQILLTLQAKGIAHEPPATQLPESAR